MNLTVEKWKESNGGPAGQCLTVQNDHYLSVGLTVQNCEGLIASLILQKHQGLTVSLTEVKGGVDEVRSFESASLIALGWQPWLGNNRALEVGENWRS